KSRLDANMLACFFFQAEDGIRDRNVTGVQTCALPIYYKKSTRKDLTMKHVTKVFWISIAIVAIAVFAGIVAPEGLERVTTNLQDLITTNFGWYYLILVTFVVLFCLFFIVSPMGAIKLGKPDDEPEYSTVTWFAMLFSAGMGIGLVFFGAAEPLSHFVTPATAEGETAEAFKEAMRYTFFHWGIHAWAVYGVVALGLAYFKFRKGAPGLISATL